MPPSASGAPTCPHCGGGGWVLDRDRPNAVAVRCGCRQKSLGPRLLEAAGLPPRYARCTFEKFKVDVPDPAQRAALTRALELSKQYVDRFEAGGVSSGLLYVGPPGVGKTHLAAAVLSELIRRCRVRGLFVDFTSLIHRIQSTFESGSSQTKHGVLGPVKRAELLVLDELGAQKPSEWVTDILYLIMNARYSAQLPTLFTTNYLLEPGDAAAPAGRDWSRRLDAPVRPLLSQRIAASLVSRLHEMAQPIVIEADDFREKIGGKQLRTGIARG